MNEQQIEVLEITQQVMRAMLVALGALNPAAMSAVGHALRTASLHEDLSPNARVSLSDLADGVEMLFGGPQAGH